MSDSGTLRLIAGTSNLPLAEGIADRLGVGLLARTVERFADSELHVELEDSVRGGDVYVIQPTGPPVDQHVFELLFLADASRRAGAAAVTAVMPYFGYSRQDRRATGRGAVGGRVAADLLASVGIGRVLAVDLHVVSLEGFFPMPVEHLSAVPALVERVRAQASPASVIVAADLGAAKLAAHYAEALGLPTAMVHKHRVSGERVQVRGIAGEVRDRVPIIVDDMISTGGTIEAAVDAVRRAGSRPECSVVATHGILVGGALERLARAGVRSVIVTDSVLPGVGKSAAFETVTIAPLLAEAIDRLHHGRSLRELIKHD